MKPFNLKDALAGKAVVTRGGKKVVGITCLPYANDKYRVAVQIEDQTQPTFVSETGRHWCSNSETQSCSWDLFMASEKKTGWVTIYHSSSGRQATASRIFPTEEEAVAYAVRIWGPLHGRIPAKIEWEE